MFSKTQLFKKYISYLLHSSSGKGHGVHSPFVFDFITQALNDTNKYPDYTTIEQLRSRLKKETKIITIQDMGAGSRVNSEKKRRIKDIAKSALKPEKYAQLLYRIVKHYQPTTIIELGTSLGITASYLSLGQPKGSVYTFEGAQEVAAIARKNFAKLSIRNIQLSEGNFDDTLPDFLHNRKNTKIDFAFVDGNHRREPTIRYFNQMLPHVHTHSIIVFDDIHWSEEMESAWDTIKQNDAVTLTIDLFFIGLVFFRNENKEKEHFAIRF